MEKNILFQIKLLHNSIVRNICNDMKKHVMISPPSLIQAEIIGYLIRHEGQEVYQKDLESVFKLRRSTISGVLQTLEKRNMIIRTSSEIDVRVKKVILTPEAVQHFERADVYLEELEKKVIKNITEEDLLIFYEVLEQMQSNLEDS